MVAQGSFGNSAANTLFALDHDGSLLWVSETNGLPSGGQGGGAPAIADLDCDGVAEIVLGRSVWSGLDGTRFWTPAEGGGVGANGLSGPISVPVDVDGDGILEVVAGASCYRWNGVRGAGSIGELLWRNEIIGDGYVGVGNFHGDDSPEIVVVGSGQLAVLEGESGDLKWIRDLLDDRGERLGRPRYEPPKMTGRALRRERKRRRGF